MNFSDHGIVTKRHSGHERTPCPQCGPTRKKTHEACLSVDHDEGAFFCHHCGWSGGLKKQTRGERKVTYIKPATPVAQSADGMEPWFQERGISMEVVRRNKIFKTTTWMPAGDKTAVIAFPYYRDGELINIKYRSKAKGFRMEKGAERILYGLDDLNLMRMFIVEGEMDKLALEMAGYTNVVSVPDGAPSEASKNYGTKFDYLGDPRLQEVQSWVIAVDSDGPGMVLKEELIRRLGDEKCSVVEWEKDCKDANDVLMKWGVENLRKNLEDARPVPVEGIFKASEMEHELSGIYDHDIEGGLTTGWTAVDSYITVMPGQLNVVTGIPGHGKSEWLDALCVNMAHIHGWKAAFFSPENYPLKLHVRKIVEKYVGKTMQKTHPGRMSKMEWECGLEWVSNFFLWIMPKKPTLEEILAKAKTAVVQEGIRILVIDPWNEVETTRPSGVSETEYVSQSLSLMRRFARTHNVSVYVVAHPRIMQKDGNGNYPCPSPYDISGSANWRNKADNCFAIYRDLSVQGGTVEVHVQKVKFKVCGKIGKADLSYDYDSGRYMEGGWSPAPLQLLQQLKGKVEAF